MLRSSLALTAVLCLPAPVAASASTANVDPFDGRIHVAAAPGEVNVVSIGQADPAWQPDVMDSAGVTTQNCWVHTATHVRCPASSPVVALGDRDDRLTYHDSDTTFLLGRADVDGGPGDDTITTAMSGDHVDGGEGADTINAFVGDDVVDGGAANDTLDGDFGADTLTGGPGEDILLGGTDNDIIRARDGEHDRIRCDDGADKVEADRLDEVHADCETVEIPAEPGDGGGSGSSESGSGSGGSGSGGSGSGSTITPGVPAAADRTAPRLTVVRRQRRRGVTTLTVRCDEGCTVTARAGRRTATRTLLAGRTGRLVVRGRRIALTARDAAGNSVRRTVRAPG